MALTDAPTIRIGTETISKTWTLTGRIGLEGLRITFGRRSHIDRAQPATLYCEILDTDQHLEGYTHLTGQPITVERAASDVDPARVIFRGRVTDYDVEVVWISDPELFYRRKVWKLAISASDRLADLANAILPGPGQAFAAALGPSYWETQSAGSRINAILAQGAGDIIDNLDWRDPYPATDAPLVRMIPWSEKRSALDLIEGLYSAHPLGYPIYEPSTNSVLLGKPAVADKIALAWDGATLRIEVRSGYAIPASKVVVPEGYKASTGIEEAVDIVHVASGFTSVTDNTQGGFDVEYIETIVEHAVPGYDLVAGGRRELRVDVDYQYKTPPPEVEPTPDPTNDFAWPFSLTYVTSEYGWRESTNSFHAGMDFSYGGIGGAAIHPVGAGAVSRNVAWHAGWGNYVVIDHGNGLETLYAHMQQPSTLQVGEAVTKATTLGFVGNTGNSFGDHLHLETWVNGQHMNPRTWMDQYGTAPAAAAASEPGLWQTQIAADTAAALGQLTGKAVLPTLRLDWRHFEYDYAITYGWLDTACKQVPVYFPGSVFADMLDVGNVHQIIGGTLVYADGGWTLDATVAPALKGGTSLTVAQLVTLDAPELQDFDADITIADLGNVTIGAT
ncbi:M23 family metallopeptidase [Microbacterium sp. KNMS]